MKECNECGEYYKDVLLYCPDCGWPNEDIEEDEDIDFEQDDL